MSTVGPFPSTHWSLVDRAGDGLGPAQRQALGDLVRRYLPALRFHLVADRRLDPDRAEDLLQGFLASKMLEQGLVAQARPGRGRFRNFLLVSLRRFIATEARRQRAAGRSPDRPFVPLSQAIHPPDRRPAPPADYDVGWAKEVLAAAVARMREECEAGGRAHLWEVFEARVLAPAQGRSEPLEYDQLVKRFGLASPAQASNLLVTAKRTFVRALREVVGEYAASEQEIDEELRDLRAALAAAPL